MPPPAETEIKLELPANQVARARRLPVLKKIPAKKTQTLQSVYFDTEKQNLRKNGLSLRVRRVDGRQLQTIKQSGGRSTGLFERREWECPVADGQPDLKAARGTALAPLLGKKLRRNLKPVFETRVRRTVYPIRKHGSEIAFSIDTGTIKAAKRSAALCEIELELVDGRPRELFNVARTLAKSLPIELATRSKAEQGYALIDGQAGGSAKAKRVALTPDADWATAFKTIARACLYQIAANAGALRREDANAVHQMRVGIRKLRAAMSLFKEVLAGAQTEAIKAELKWITAELGPARELDVFVKRVVKTVEDDGAAGADVDTGGVAKRFRRHRAAAFDRAAQAVAAARFRRLALDTAAWIEVGDWIAGDGERDRVRRERAADAAARQMRRRRKKIRKRGARLVELDPGRRHKLRIQVKKLRYACEFFGALFPGKKLSRRRKRFVAGLTELQDALGDLNDIIVHERLAQRSLAAPDRAAASRRRATTVFAAGHLSGREDARFAPALENAARAYKAFAKAKPFWR